jgi:hypothetical protein
MKMVEAPMEPATTIPVPPIPVGATTATTTINTLTLSATVAAAAATLTMTAVTSSSTEDDDCKCPTVAEDSRDYNAIMAELQGKALANTPPHIIECAEANAGESHAACHLPKKQCFAALGQKGTTIGMVWGCHILW